MEPTCNVPSPVDAPARLSYAQKRDLLGQAVAAVITTALIAAPLLTPPTDAGVESPQAALPASSFAAPVALIEVAGGVRSPLLQDIGRPAEARKRIRSVSYASMTAAPMAGSGVVSETPVGTTGRKPARKPFSRRVAGWLTGNGTHTVRPFPTIAAGRS